MHKKHLGPFACILINLFNILLPKENTAQQLTSSFPTIPIRLDTSYPIRIEPGPIALQLPDFSKVGGQLGTGIGDFFSLGARSFADTMHNDEYGKQMTRGMSGFANNLGGAVRGFNKEAEKKLFPELSTTFRGFMGSAINSHNVFRFGGLTALSFAVSITGYYATKLLWEVISYKILHPKPVILLPDTNYGRWDRIKRWWNGYSTPSMIFDTAVKERLEEVEEKTKYIRDYNKKRKNRRNKISYDNLLLYGKPGTGKTLFARVLADKTNMDFVATTAASLLQSGTAGVKYWNDIMAMAKRSSYGMILFIDEADALFVDRETLNPESDHYKVLSHILAILGDGNTSFMLIAATNHAYIMDSAMGRRFQDRVHMPLPDVHTRAELISLYSDSFLFNTKKNNKVFVENSRKIFNKKRMERIVQQSEGLSHAEIKDMIAGMHKKACASKDGMLTKKHIRDSINQAIEKHKIMEEEKKKREERIALKMY